MIKALIFASIIELAGVTGSELRVRAFFDANNVKVGDPLVLTIDFVGEADFKSLHPPELSRHVNASDWKIYDDSAKTDTYRDARRLTYRVRPMRPGVLWFPELEFSYSSSAKTNSVIVRSNRIPVHATGSVQVKVEEMGAVENEMPQPGELLTDRGVEMTDDEAFAWRKACAKPSADAFAQFSGSVARLNEARMAILEGNWARALKIYSRLEWVIGQTPEIERGIVAALALKYDNISAVLPVWRDVARPVLKYSWKGRLSIIGLSLIVLLAFYKVVSRLIKAIAVLAIAFALPFQSFAQQDNNDIFRMMEEQARQMQERMDRLMSFDSDSMMGFPSQKRKPVKIVAGASLDRDHVCVGEPFDFIIEIDVPKNCRLSQLRIAPTVSEGLSFVGKPFNMTDVQSENPSNIIKRIALPSRFDTTYKGPIAFEINGLVSQNTKSNVGGFFSMSFSNSIRLLSSPLEIDVKPLPEKDRPNDFSGIVAKNLVINEYPDLIKVGTNDVVTIKYVFNVDGYVPKFYLPKDCAFEVVRDNGRIEFIRYFVADGAPTTPSIKISYWDIDRKEYRRVSAGATKLEYRDDFSHSH